jgi:hypothetical protein
MDEYLEKPRRAQPDDLIGGWCITLKDDWRTPAEGARTLADFCDEPLAVHVADLHNKWLEEQA